MCLGQNGSCDVFGSASTSTSKRSASLGTELLANRRLLTLEIRHRNLEQDRPASASGLSKSRLSNPCAKTANEASEPHPRRHSVTR